MKNITTPLGGICVVDKVEKDYGLISSMFGDVLNPNDIGRVKLIKDSARKAITIAPIIASFVKWRIGLISIPSFRLRISFSAASLCLYMPSISIALASTVLSKMKNPSTPVI